MTLDDGTARGKVVAIHQPNFLPWCGYFAKASKADIFVFLDDAQMPKGSYVARTQISLSGKAKWMSVPYTGDFGVPINDVEILQGRWLEKLLRTLEQTYRKAPYYAEVMEHIGPVLKAPPVKLAEYNQRLVECVFRFLGWEKTIVRSSDLDIHSTSDDRLIEIVTRLNGACYLSGKGGTNYQAPEKFQAAGIELNVQQYTPIAYARGSEGFVPGLSIIDALFYLGRNTMDVLCYTSL